MEQSLTGYAICFVFLIIALLAYLEEYIGKYKLPIYLGICISLILIAGTREVGGDPDSANYADTFSTILAGGEKLLVEYSFILLSKFVSVFGNDVHILFFIYATLGVSLKFIAFRQLSESWFFPVLFYISYFFVFHECMQIRTGVLSAMFLLSIKPWCEGQKLKALGYLIIGFFFHYSAIMLFPLLFLGNKSMSLKERFFWALLIPCSYIIFYGGFSFLLDVSTNLPYIGEKLAAYQMGVERGLSNLFVNVFSPLFLFTAFLYYYLLYFHDTLIEKNKYFPLMIKLLGLGIFAYVALGSLPALAQRVNLLLRVVSIILYANVFYTLLPRWASISIAIVIAFIFLNYAVPSISFHLFWDPGEFF